MMKMSQMIKVKNMASGRPISRRLNTNRDSLGKRRHSAASSQKLKKEIRTPVKATKGALLPPASAI
ncbi:hypothetical protein D3C73_1523470 [compost metagenome]